MQIIVIGLGGFIGAVLRYVISGYSYRLLGSNFPWGTLIVNILGSFILGAFLFLAEERIIISPQMRNFIAIGIMGSLTTFSTFSYETYIFLQESLYRQAFYNIILNCFTTIFSVWMGISLVKYLFSKI